LTIDTSAIVAVVGAEVDAPKLLAKLEGRDLLTVGAPTLVEASMVLGGRTGAAGIEALRRFAQRHTLVIVPYGRAHWDVAADAFLRYGKGRHPAALNFGDCLTYAVAKIAGEPLLCLGNDFAQTDLELVRL
jgi:ribonuclease VapC